MSFIYIYLLCSVITSACSPSTFANEKPHLKTLKMIVNQMYIFLCFSRPFQLFYSFFVIVIFFKLLLNHVQLKGLRKGKFGSNSKEAFF